MDSRSALAPLAFRPESVSELVYAAIRDAIVHKQLAPGERVTEAGIAKRLDVSKTPVREAMLRLQEVGLIESDGSRGSRVVQPSPAAFEQAFEAREVLEGRFAEKVAERPDPALAAALDTAARDSLAAAEAGDAEAFRQADRAFHRLVVDAAGNPRLAKVVDDSVDLLSAIRERDFPYRQAMVPCARAHLTIAEAIGAGKDEIAGDLMRAHIRNVRAYIEADRAESG